ncbi:MAG: alanine--glyoxylate aminotransferase family protein [Deltaproteobacteria bacterium]|nr:alanine--glyoxylate aminotransferase family protein [Deltaproteobacteria bacterium]
MLKNHLFTPGPTPVPPRTLLAMASPIIHHRSPEFSQILAEVKEGLKYVFQTNNDVLLFASTGTGAMEGAVANALSPGEKALVVRGGKFGERWAEICKAYGIETINLDIEWGRCVKVEKILEYLIKYNDIKAVFIQAHETSTGVKFPLKEIGEALKDRDVILVVDAISALGAIELLVDDWHLDIVVGASQKALMLPPGLSFVSISEKGWKWIERSKLPKYYFDFKKEADALKRNQPAYTSAVSLVIGLLENLRYIKKRGLKNIIEHHKRLSEATKSAIKAMGLNLFTKEGLSEAITVVEVPPGIDGKEIVRLLKEEYGIMIAGGQGRLKGKIFRISHMGYVDENDIIVVISALEAVLNKLGYHVKKGVGIKAAQDILFH